ncbi:MAG: MerR family transcriptional regulator, partial [Oscillospiraceae bacterium]|nr:MerR family transcriptional regulator [Oscillospiraceae bacterium]
MKTVKEFAALTGVSIRTLHYYDEIGLLRPASVTDSGYRLYGQQELERLQQILFLRELRFSLKEIAQILDDPTFDKRQALHQHRQLLLLQRQRLDELIRLADNTLKGGSQMNFDLLKHDPAREMQEEYANEVRQRWGNTEAYAESQRKTAG